MCTVTYIPVKNGAVITSNRDEHFARGKTLLPQCYLHNGSTITYPKDEKGNGTWIGFNERNIAAVLLNGAFEKHLRKSDYKQSRGFIIPAILQKTDPFTGIENIDFAGIEPFTMIVFGNSQLVQYRWDETKLHKAELDTATLHLWSSATLYSSQMQQKNSLELLQLYHDNVSSNDILDFHKKKKYELQLPDDSEANGIKTVSITQIKLLDGTASMQYFIQ